MPVDILESILQLIIYKEIRERFKDHLWLDVVSKCDLLQSSPTILVEDEDVEVKRYRKSGPEGAIHVSVKSEIGIIQVSMNPHSSHLPSTLPKILISSPSTSYVFLLMEIYS